MSGQRKNNFPLTRHGVITEEAMLAYLKGELSPENTAAFEKLLAEDPFAREALEGLQTVNAVTLKNTLTNISQGIAQKAGTAKSTHTVSFFYVARYVVAAVLLGLLIGLTFLINNYLNKQARHVSLNKDEEASLQQQPSLLFQENEGENKQESAPSSAASSEDEMTSSSLPSEIISKQSETAVSATEPAPTANSISDPTVVSNPTALLPKPAEKSPLSLQEKKAVKESSANPNTPVGNVLTKPTEVNAQNTKPETTARTIVPTSAAADKTSSSDQNSDSEINQYSATMDEAMQSFNNRNYKAAAKQFGKIADKDPSNLDALYFEGISHFINGDNNKALKNFEKIIAKGAKHTDGSKWYKAQILLKKGKEEEAKTLLLELSSSSGTFKDRAINKLQELE
jgi:tetratricopeptide (TPR) repeat protein